MLYFQEFKSNIYFSPTSDIGDVSWTTFPDASRTVGGFTAAAAMVTVAVYIK